MASVQTAIEAARSKLGSPYVWGAEGPNSFDCSGLMVWAWQKAGVTLPRTSQQQARYGTAVPLSKIQPGDLVTSNWGSGPSSHVGMYLGNGQIIHAPRPGRTVTIATIDDNYRKHIDTVRRVPGVAQNADQAVDLPGPADELGELLGEAAPGLTGGLLAPVRLMSAALDSVSQSLKSVGAVAEFLLKLALPSTWVRIVSGLLGTVLLFLGIGFLVREARGGG